MPSTATLPTRLPQGLAALLCSALLSTISCAETMMKEPANSSDRQLTEKIIRQLSPCFQTVGVTQAAAHAFPQATALPPDSELVVVTAMPTTGPKISDSYHYTLAVHQSRQQVFIKQVGGIGGLQKVFGPIPVDSRCQQEGSREK
ncbi:hypothetical protein [Undibacterium sp. WLX3042]|uniref:hypothetical protein n=1 Tax=Undibacterium sp. WLX3042 TaxID=3412686 RepID=UPI003C2B566E